MNVTGCFTTLQTVEGRWTRLGVACNEITIYVPPLHELLIHDGGDVASITIRNLDARVKRRLRIRAAEHGRSLEEEARVILRRAVGEEDMPAKGLGTAIQDLFAPLGGVELEIPPREPMRGPPRLD